MVISLVGLLVFATGVVMTLCGLVWDLSINFDCAPWRVALEEALAAAAKGTDPQTVPLTCPFYASEPADTQCIACGTVVSRSGLHEARCGGAASRLRRTTELTLRAPRNATRAATPQDKVTSLNEIVLDWGRAMEARNPAFAPPPAAQVLTRDDAGLRFPKSQAVERKDDVRLARADLDAALDFTGNFTMCQVSKCCIGASSFDLRQICVAC